MLNLHNCPTKENLNLLLKFMGFEKKTYFPKISYLIPIFTCRHKGCVNWVDELDIDFENDLNLLMAVVDKIESFTNEGTNSYTYNVIIQQSFVDIVENHTSEEIVNLDKETKTEAIYAAVVEFVKWYEKTKWG